MSEGLLCKLLARGHDVSFECGRLVITPGGYREVPRAWFEKNKPALASEVIRALHVNALRYIDFSVGNFNSGRAAGVRIVFEHYLSGTPARVFFNAGITRARSTAAGKKGTRLPGRQFHPKRGSKFIQFWIRTGLAEPRYISEYHEYMGRLKSIVMTCVCDEDGRIEKDTLRPLSIQADQVRSAVLGGNMGSGSSRVDGGMPSVNFRDRISGSGLVNRAYLQGLRGNSGAAPGSANEVISITGGDVLPFPTTIPVNDTSAESRNPENADQLTATDLREETDADWWASYDSAEANRSRSTERE